MSQFAGGQSDAWTRRFVRGAVETYLRGTVPREWLRTELSLVPDHVVRRVVRVEAADWERDEALHDDRLAWVRETYR